jgi:hypothetical protein
MRAPDPDEAWVLADRLAWYVSLGVPPGLSELQVEDRDEFGSVVSSRPMDRQEIYDLILNGASDATVLFARNVRTPLEEASRLVATGAVSEINDLRIEVDEDKPDPYRGYRRRLLEYEEMVRERVRVAQGDQGR